MKKFLIVLALAGQVQAAPAPEVYSAEDPAASPTHPDMNITRIPDKKPLPGIPVTGRIFTDVFIPTRATSTTPFRQASTSFWLEGNPQLNENSSGIFILQADLLENSSSTLRTILREGYVRYGKSGFELRAGRQIVPWGSSDAINPTDFLSAKDFTFFNPDDEVRRIGHTSLIGSWTPNSGSSSWTFTAVWTPVAPQSRLLINPASVPAGITLTGAAISQPQTFSNSEAALRASYQGTGWDGAITAFRGWTHMPHFQAASPAVIFQTFQRRRALGLDGSYTTGKWVLRTESAYNWTENDDGLNPVLQPSHLDLVAGAERPIWGDDLRGQVQFLWRYHPHFIEAAGAGPLLAPLAAANALVLGYQFRSRAGFTLRLSYAPEGQDWTGELFTIGNVTGGDYLVRPKLTYAFSPAFKGTLGTEYYGGPVDRPLGALQLFNSAFVEAKYTF